MNQTMNLMMTLLRPRRRNKYLKRILEHMSKSNPSTFLDVCKSIGINQVRYHFLGKYPMLLDTRGQSIAEEVLEKGCFQASLFATLSDLYATRDVCFVNIGANIGTSCLSAHAMGFRDFIAFEPVRSNFELLEHNLAQLKETSRIELRREAVGDVAGTGIINLNPSSIGRHSFVRDFHKGQEEVPLVRLDDVLPARKGFLFMDTEGYELNVLKGAPEYLRNHADGICAEITPALMGQNRVSEIDDILQENFPFLYDADGKRYKSLKEVRALQEGHQVDIIGLKTAR
jgi:FkbM family methyltransferase